VLLQLCKAHLKSLHRRERVLLKKANSGDVIDENILRSASRKRKQAREVIFLA